jgi:hypothetical protein
MREKCLLKVPETCIFFFNIGYYDWIVCEAEISAENNIGKMESMVRGPRNLIFPQLIGKILTTEGALSMGVKWPEREADRAPPTSAEVKKIWIYTSTPQYVFMA